MDSFKPLVSVAVVTYNSSKTVVETLDSIYNQTYPNLELIVSDDCSKDDTIGICREWIEVHKKRFVRTELLTVKKNTGVSANSNRGNAACYGGWIKGIAGDDVLLPDCIETYVNYICEHPEAIIVFAKMELFGGTEERRKFVENQFLFDFFNWTPEEQYDFLTLERNCIPAPTCFYNKYKIEVLNIKNDERIPLLEDWPKWIKMTKAGVRFHFIDKVTVKYRVAESSLSTTEKKSLAYRKSSAKVYLYYCFINDYKKNSKKGAVLKWLRKQRFVHDNNLFWRVVVKVYQFIFSIQ